MLRNTSDDEYSMLTMVIRDAYLEVPPGERVIASMPADYSQKSEYEFDRCIPGQRDGSLKWHDYLMSYLKTKCKVEVCKACPAIVIVDGGRMIVHVDDMMVVAPKHWLMKVFIPFMEERFDCTWELATNSGDTVSFLKRKHMVTDSGVIIHGQPELFDKMCDVLGVSAKRTSKSPCTRELVKDIDSPQLDPERASKFRQPLALRCMLQQTGQTRVLLSGHLPKDCHIPQSLTGRRHRSWHLTLGAQRASLHM